MQVVRRAFALRPYPVPTLEPSGEYLTRVWREAVYPMAQRMGMALRLPPVQPRSRLAHAAAFFAAANSRLEEFQEGVYRAFFERGEDIGCVEVLAVLGREIGLDAAALRLALETRKFEAQVVADEDRAQSLGVRAVPAYVTRGERVVMGVRNLAELRALLTSE